MGAGTDARNTFRIVYDPATRKFSLTKWTDAAGLVPLTGQQSITLFSGAVVMILQPPGTAGASTSLSRSSSRSSSIPILIPIFVSIRVD